MINHTNRSYRVNRSRPSVRSITLRLNAIKFVQTNNEKLTIASKNEDDKESEESDYDENIGAGAQKTINQVF